MWLPWLGTRLNGKTEELRYRDRFVEGPGEDRDESVRRLSVVGDELVGVLRRGIRTAWKGVYGGSMLEARSFVAHGTLG